MSQREIRITVPALQSIPVRAAGDFIFCQSAARPVVVRLNEQALTMRAGDKRRIERKPSDQQAPAFDIFELDNSASDLPLAVTLIVGVGDFNSQIVSGELIVAPGIASADGSYVVDSRHDVQLNIAITNYNTVNEAAGQVIVSGEDSGTGVNEFAPVVVNDAVYMMGNSSNRLMVWDRATGKFTTSYILPGIGATFGSYDLAYNGADLIIACGAIGGTKKLYAINVNTLGVSDISALTGAGAEYAQFSGVCCTDQYLYVLFTDVGGYAERLQIREKFAPFDLVADVDVSGGGNFMSATYCISYDEISNRIYTWSGSNYRLINLDDDGMVIDAPVAVTNYVGVALGSFGRDMRAGENRILGGQAGNSYREYAFAAATYYGQGFATIDAATHLIEPEQIEYIGAAVSKFISAGRVGLAGEVVRAIIELHTGQPARADYLDFVYGFSYFDPQQKRQRTKTSGGESFMAAGVEDYFVTEFPGAVVLTVRDGLF